MSISSLGSEHQGFTFPSIEEVDPNRSKVQPPQNQVKSSKCKRTDSFKSALLENICAESLNFEDARHSCSMISNEGTTISDYDPEKFLRNALGDVASLSESGICNVSNKCY